MCTLDQLKDRHSPCECETSEITAVLGRRPSRRAILTSALAFSAAPLIARMPAMAGSTLAVSDIAPGVFVHQGRYELQSPENRGDMANASFVIGNDSVAVIDTLGSAKVGRELRAAIKAVTDKPIRYIINTHMHPDHVFGNAAFKEDNPEFVGHHKLRRGLEARAQSYMASSKDMLGEDAFDGSEIILPTKGVDDTLTIDLGGRSLVCEAQKTAHTDNDLIVTDSTTGTAFFGDLLFSGHIPTLDGSLRGWLSLIEQLEGRTVARVVPGHGPHAMHMPEGILPEKQYWSVVAADVRRLIKEGNSLTEATKVAGQSERSNWKLFEQYHVRNVIAAFAELEWE
ncbi:quinoprotein relay system zinc metallohydrolase 2 [Hyphomicrobium sp.]|uniref:quinoprotein relay system zinc metallohydrolase 2 n=1 Tax=Hyphomicrobium sp. TaxID=82 RepID=UPI002E374294|nr:quinoprotein relay system zinc metallohydrolase 2 [Hyphomicrobium sp.]HEX2839658.1 quinoprotein relay system zinc metallohydrolase 2 [Hyphomicrobium sp.]